MIAFLNGTLIARMSQSIFIDVSGVGFEVFVPQSSLAKLPELGSLVHVMTHLQIRDDGMSLYGFLSTEEKTLFEKLIEINGVGPKVALAALSFFSPQELVNAIALQDVARVSKIPGVGKKTAQRIILELKGAVDDGLGGLFGKDLQDLAAGSCAGANLQENTLKGIVDALLSMGFTLAEARLALTGVPEDASEETILQYALKRLGSRV